MTGGRHFDRFEIRIPIGAGRVHRGLAARPGAAARRRLVRAREREQPHEPHNQLVAQVLSEAGFGTLCEYELVIVPGATHLFEEPGALEEVAQLARVVRTPRRRTEPVELVLPKKRFFDRNRNRFHALTGCGKRRDLRIDFAGLFRYHRGKSPRYVL